MLSSKLQLTLRDRKVLAAILALVLLCSMVSALIAYEAGTKAQESTAPTMQTLSGGIAPGAPTYTVWVESDTYYSKTASGIISSSLDCSSLFNSIAGNNVKIYVSIGNYYWTSAFSKTVSNFTLEAPIGTQFIASSLFPASTYGYYNFFAFIGGSNIIIKGITFDFQNKAFDYGVVLGSGSPTNNVQVLDCTFINGYHPTVYFETMALINLGGSGDKFIDNQFTSVAQGIVVAASTGETSNIQIIRNTFTSCRSPIDFSNDAATYQMSHVTISDNNIYTPYIDGYGVIGINLYLYVTDIDYSVLRNVLLFNTNSNATGIALTRTPSATIAYNYVANATFTLQSDLIGGIVLRGTNGTQVHDNTLVGCTYGICTVQYYGTPSFNNIYGNIISNSGTASIITLNGYRNTISGWNGTSYIGGSQTVTFPVSAIVNTNAGYQKDNNWPAILIYGAGGQAIIPFTLPVSVENIISASVIIVESSATNSSAQFTLSVDCGAIGGIWHRAVTSSTITQSLTQNKLETIDLLPALNTIGALQNDYGGVVITWLGVDMYVWGISITYILGS